MRYKLIMLILVTVFKLNAQTEGISYQAVIIGSTDKELPGINTSNNLLISSSVSFEFTIVDENDNPLYRETQSTQTDSKGLVHLIIGSGSPSVGLFNEIMWDGTLKNLIVEIDLKGGTDFSFLSQQSFLYLPYEYHRNITATGDVDINGDFNVEGLTQFNDEVRLDGDNYIRGLLTVDGGTILNIISPAARSNNNKALTVNGYSLINGNLEVANSSITSLTGKLIVDGIANLNSRLNVEGATSLNDTLTVSNSLIVEGVTSLNDTLTVSNSLIIDNRSSSILTGPLQVDGSVQFNDQFRVAGGLSTNLSGVLNVSGLSTLNRLTVANASPSILTGILQVGGATQINNNLTVTGLAQFNATNITGSSTLNDLIVTNNTNIGGSLTVSGTTLLNSLDITNDLNLFGNLTVGGTTQLNNTLNVTGQVGIGTTTPEVSSILDVSSTTKGLLTPRMTEIQKNAISSPATGLLLYQTDIFKGFYYRDTTSWWRILSTSDNISFEIGSVKVGTTSYGLQNTQLGDDTFNNSTSGSNNTAIGYNAIYASNGSDNTALGTNALRNGVSSTVHGIFNTAIGSAALSLGDDGSFNTAIGGNSINRAQGSRNSGLGYRTLFFNTFGNDNTAVGYNAGDLNVSGSSNTLIGSEADVSAFYLSNATAIGANATVNASNKIQLGDTNITNVRTFGTITVGVITIPKTDGTANQVLETDGSGTLSWTTPITDVTDEFSSTASQTTFTLSQIPHTNSKVKMFVNGVRISNNAYSWSTTTGALTYLPVNNSGYALSSGDRIQFDYFH